MRWDEHEPIIHIWWYISPPHLNVGSGFVWFQVFQVKSCQTSSAFCLFFCFSFSSVIWSAKYAVSCLVLFMFRVVRYSLSLGRDMERNQSQNQRMWEEQDDNSGKGEKWKTRAECWMVKWMRMVVNMPYMKTGMQHYILLWNYHGYHAYFLTVFIIFTQFYILFSNIYIWVCVCVFIWGISNNSIPLTHSHHHHLLSLFMLQKYRERER